jgi:hypothetical protein
MKPDNPGRSRDAVEAAFTLMRSLFKDRSCLRLSGSVRLLDPSACARRASDAKSAPAGSADSARALS